MEYLTCAFEVKASGDEGIITGYGSVFGNVDSYGDTVAPGAFRKTILDAKTGVSQWPAMLLQHGDDTVDGRMPVGIWLEMTEDSKGLRLKGKMADTKRGRETLALLKMTPRAALNGLSIGYRAKDFELHGKGSPARRTLKAVDLVEVSLVTFPADRFARVGSVKSWFDDEPEAEAMTMKDVAWMQFIELRRLMNGNGR
jgi:uncharacterized protein